MYGKLNASQNTCMVAHQGLDPSLVSAVVCRNRKGPHLALHKTRLGAVVESTLSQPVLQLI